MAHFTPLITVHAVGALVVLLLGPVQIFRPRRDRAHRMLGRTWVGAMVLTCLTSFAIHPHGVSWLHGLAVFTLVMVVLAVRQVRRGQVASHQRGMIGSYLGTAVAFAFAALVPTRAIQTTLHQSPAVVLGTTAAVTVVVGLWVVGVLRLTAASPGAGRARRTVRA